MVLLERIELSTSPLPRVRSTTELQQRPGRPGTPVRGAGAAYGGAAFACQGARLDAGSISPHRRGVSKPPSPADIERERRLAEALRANLRKRKAQAREAKDEPPSKD